MLQKYDHLLERLKQHDEELFTEWTEGVEEICEKHLQEPLLTLDTDMGLYQVNFSFAVRTFLSSLLSGKKPCHLKDNLET